MMERIGNEIARELRRFGAPAGMVGVLRVWPAAVGEAISRNAWPARVARDGTLHVATSSSAWAFELSQLAPSMLKRLREELGEDAPAALRFALGRLPEVGAETAPRRSAQHVEPAPEQRARAEQLAAPIADSDLRERVTRAASLGLQRASYGRSV